MSVLDEYEIVPSIMDKDEYAMIDRYISKSCSKGNYEKYEKELQNIRKFPFEQWLKAKQKLEKEYNIIFFYDVIYNQEEYAKYNAWFNNVYNKRKVDILNIYDNTQGYIRCNAILYKKGKPIANVVVSYDEDYIDYIKGYSGSSEKDIFKSLIYRDYERLISLPSISNCSLLLQDLYDRVCESDSSMFFVDDDEMWNDLFSDKYSQKDIEILKDEVRKYNLNDVITFDDNNYKIICYGKLETSFNDDRKIKKEKDRER